MIKKYINAVFHSNIKTGSFVLNFFRNATSWGSKSIYFHCDIWFEGNAEIAKSFNVIDTFGNPIIEGEIYISSGEKAGYVLMPLNEFVLKKEKEKFTGELYAIKTLVNEVELYKDIAELLNKKQKYTVVGAIFTVVDNALSRIGIDIAKIISLLGVNLGKVYSHKMFCSAMAYITYAKSAITSQGKQEFENVDKSLAMTLSPEDFAKLLRENGKKEKLLAIFVKGKNINKIHLHKN